MQAVLTEQVRELFLARTADWPAIEWDYTEWEEFFEDVRKLTGNEDISEYYEQFYY